MERRLWRILWKDNVAPNTGAIGSNFGGGLLACPQRRRRSRQGTSVLSRYGPPTAHDRRTSLKANQPPDSTRPRLGPTRGVACSQAAGHILKEE
jgi:hypothetical protein